MVQLSLALSHTIVLLVSHSSVIPPQSAVTSVGVVTLPISMFLSSTFKVLESIVVVVPCTVRSQAITTVEVAPHTVILFAPADA